MLDVVPKKDITDRSVGFFRMSFCEHVRLLMLRACKVAESPPSFDEHEHAHRPKAAQIPSLKKDIGARPAIKRNVQGIRFERPPKLTSNRKHPTLFRVL